VKALNNVLRSVLKLLSLPLYGDLFFQFEFCSMFVAGIEMFEYTTVDISVSPTNYTFVGFVGHIHI